MQPCGPDQMYLTNRRTVSCICKFNSCRSGMLGLEPVKYLIQYLFHTSGLASVLVNLIYPVSVFHTRSFRFLFYHYFPRCNERDAGEGYNFRQVQLISVTSTCLFVSSVVVGLRLFVQHLTVGKFWWDDYFAVAALIWNAIFCPTRRRADMQSAGIWFP